MVAWDVPPGRSVRLPPGVELVGQNDDDGSALYTHEGKGKYWKVIPTMMGGWHVEEWKHDELDLEDCDC